jgi:hypothetical protein
LHCIAKEPEEFCVCVSEYGHFLMTITTSNHSITDKALVVGSSAQNILAIIFGPRIVKRLGYAISYTKKKAVSFDKEM